MYHTYVGIGREPTKYHKASGNCRHSPLPHHGTRTAIRLSKPACEQTSAIHFCFAAMVTIFVVLAIAGWPNEGDLTCVLTLL
jgi:hypothetical protein